VEEWLARTLPTLAVYEEGSGVPEKEKGQRER